MEEKEIQKIIVDSEAKALIPKLMFILYSSDESYFIEVAEIDRNMNILSSKPMSNDTLRKMKDVIDNSMNEKDRWRNKDILPESVLFYNENKNVIWYSEPGKHKLYFHKDREIYYNLPTIVFNYVNDNLKIYISDTKKRPDLDTKLWDSPFPNTYSDNNICFGNIKKTDSKSIRDIIDHNNKFFFFSDFTANFSEINNEYFEIAKTKKFPKKYFDDNKHNYKLLIDLL